VIAPSVLADEQRRAVEAPPDACVTISGAPGTGKSVALAARVERARSLEPQAEPLWFPQTHRFGSFAANVLADAGAPVVLIDDVEAEAVFAAACAPLFALEWEELAAEQLDPEVPGLRSPNRFLSSAFRLIRRLRDALVEPQEFLARSLSGATEFYGKTPNLADPALLAGVKDAYHDSLAVSPAELRRQYRREVDLAKILERLYARYCDLVASERRVTARDAVALAVGILRADASRSERLRAAHRFAFVDDAGEATSGEIQLLREIFGVDLPGVTLCDAPASGERGAHFAFQQQHRSPIAIEIACRRLIGAEQVRAENVEPRLFVHRAASRSAEAAFVARHVREWLDTGTPPERIAVLFRSIRHVEVYESALLDRDVNVVTGGDANVFADRRALDALALLWNVVDPFRHDWMLRTLGNPALGLSDASLALLCAETPNPQTPLFVFEDDPAPTARASRWDPKRDLRLGWNVVRGEQDGALSSPARERLQRFRTLRAGWVNALHELAFEEFARLVWHEGLALEGAAGSARAAAQQFVLKRLLARLAAFSRERGGATADEILEYAQRRAASDLEACEDDDGSESVRLLSVEAARGREFDRVAIADVRAGAFPRWYSPDAFLYSPRLGMIPKENAGDAGAARTAKFSYYTHRNKTRERYNQRERALFAYALRRARVCALVTASQPPTKGVAAPEFLEELRRVHPPGTQWLE
jgi:hypothetical protein